MRPEKKYMLEDIRRGATGSEFVFLIDFTGLTVERMSQLRGRLKAEGAEIHVVRNTLFHRIGTELGWRRLDDVTVKPTAMVTGRDEIATARIIREYAKADEKPVAVKGGYVKGTFLAPDEVVALAVLPSKEVLRAMMVGALAGPMMKLAGVLSQKVASIVYVLKAVEKKKS